jgi:hypothetical protein
MLVAGLTAIGLLFGSASLATPEAQAAPPAADPTTISFVNEPFAGGTLFFTGDVTVERFASQAGQLVVIGTATGVVKDAAGTVLFDFTDAAFTAPVVIDQATCDILELTLGPLDLDVLGLVVFLDTVHLEIDAQPGPGNLLGNLLCGVAGLLDSGATSNVIARLLNQILGLLG